MPEKNAANRVITPAQKPKCHIHDKVQDYEDNKIRQNVCVPETEYPLTEFKGEHYCLFHLPTDEKDNNKFEEKLRERLRITEERISDIEKLPKEKQEKVKFLISYSFRYVWFPSKVDFLRYKFSARVDFNSATFSARADFTSATFSARADFTSATFSDVAYFIWATFSDEADFTSATFSDVAYYTWATFEEQSQIFFKETEFSGGLNFIYTNFKGYTAFEGKHDNRLFIGEKAILDLQNARIDEARKISFHTVRLEPGWFVNTDASEFIFTDCKWQYADEKRLNIKTELQNLKGRGFINPNALLNRACWQLADNHEESKSFSEASIFRRIANESKRLENPWYKQPFTLHWWYYAFSFYGENWRRAFFILFGILALFSVLYAMPFANFDYAGKQPPLADNYVMKICEKMRIIGNLGGMTLCDGVAHSLFVAALQRPDPKPADALTRLFVILETIFAPLQAALLALAIRRKFMR